MHMEVKRMLREYRGIKARLEILEEEILRFESIAEGTSLNMDGQPKGSGVSDKMAAFSIKAADSKSELERMVERLNRKRWKIIRMATKLTDSKQIAVIHGRYIADYEQTWAELAKTLGLTSVRQVQRIHGDALEELQKVMEQEDNA